MNIYLVVSGGMQDLATGDFIAADDQPAGDGLGLAALGTSPLGE